MSNLLKKTEVKSGIEKHAYDWRCTYIYTVRFQSLSPSFVYGYSNSCYTIINDSYMAGNNLYEQRLTAGSLDAPYEPDARYSHSMSLVSDTGKWIMYGEFLKDGKYLYIQLNPFSC